MQSAPVGERLLTPRLELSRHSRPRVALRDEPAPRGAERPPPGGVAKERHDRAGELPRIVGPKEMRPGDEREALSAHRGGHDRLRHGVSREVLASCTVAYPKWR